MPYLERQIINLVDAGYSRPAQANSFFPAGNQQRHIHLGTPTAVGDQYAPPESVLVTYISIKVDGVNLGNIDRCENGSFNARTVPAATPLEFLEALDQLGLLSDNCN